MKHGWHFFRAGGVDQVSLRDGNDLLAFRDPDRKLWIALAMPVAGVDIDPETLSLLDLDHDGRLRVPEMRSRPISPHGGAGEPSRETLVDLDAPVLLHEDTTDVGLPLVDIRIAESAGGGGGVLQVANVSIQLSTNQTRLVALLAHRMIAEIEQPSFVRGFVRSSELLGSLVWDSPDPDDNHVKQLVRRTRRQLVRCVDVTQLLDLCCQRLADLLLARRGGEAAHGNARFIPLCERGLELGHLLRDEVLLVTDLVL